MEAAPTLALRLREPTRDFPLVPGEVPVDLDRWLAAEEARSWTLFLGLATEGVDRDKGRRKARAELVKRRASPAELLDPASDEPPLEGVLVLDLKGEKARSLGRELGATRLLRGVAGRPFDPEPKTTEDEDMQAAARRGLAEMIHTLGELPTRLGPTPLATLAAAVVLLAAWAALYFTSLELPAELTAGRAQVLGPLLFFGAYLRWRVHGEAFAAARSDAPGWERMRHELLAIWIVAVPLVLAFGAADLQGRDELHVAELFDGLPTPLVLVLWLLPALSLARGFDEFFGNLFAAGFNALLCVFLLKLAYFFTGFVTDLFWSFLGPLLREFLPAALVDPFGVAFGILAELAFLAYLLGYAWTRQRPWFDGDPDPLEA